MLFLQSYAFTDARDFNLDATKLNQHMRPRCSREAQRGRRYTSLIVEINNLIQRAPFRLSRSSRGATQFQRRTVNCLLSPYLALNVNSLHLFILIYYKCTESLRGSPCLRVSPFDCISASLPRLERMAGLVQTVKLHLQIVSK